MDSVTRFNYLTEADAKAITTLYAEKFALEDKIAALQAERDDWREKHWKVDADFHRLFQDSQAQFAALREANAALEKQVEHYRSDWHKGAQEWLKAEHAGLIEKIAALTAAVEGKDGAGNVFALRIARVFERKMIDTPAKCVSCGLTAVAPTTGKLMNDCHCGGELRTVSTPLLPRRQPTPSPETKV